MSIKTGLIQLSTDVKTAAATATATTSTGIGTIFDWIPTDIGKLATLVGIALSTILIYTHLKKYSLEIKLLKEKDKKSQKANE